MISSAVMIKNKRSFNALSCVIYDSLLFFVLLNFFLYRCVHWQGARVYYIAPDTIRNIIIAFIWLSIATECFYSLIRAGLAAVLTLLIYTFSLTSVPQSILYEIIVLILLSNLGTSNNNRNTWLIIHIICVEILFFLLLQNHAGSVYSYEAKQLLNHRGSSFGLIHTNTFALFCMSVLLMIWTFKKHKSWTSFLVFWIAAALVFFLTWSRTTFITMILCPIIMWGTEKLCNKKSKKVDRILFLLPFVMVLFSLTLSLYAIYRPEGFPKGAFWMRFTDFRVILNYSLSLFGTDGTGEYVNIWFDNIYWWLISYCGVIPALLILVGYGYMNIRLFKQKQIHLLAVSIVFLIYGIMENALVYPFHYFVPLLAFSRHNTANDMIQSENYG